MNTPSSNVEDPLHQYLKLWTLLQVFAINFICVIVAFIIWYYAWVKNLGGKLLISLTEYS